MALGSFVRRLFGKHERRVADLWRSMFLDIDAWTDRVREVHPAPARILEVGCGEGYSTERLALAFPDAEILAIDIAPNIGRLYQGPADRVRFEIRYAEDLADKVPGSFDLIVMCDVLHHVPEPARESLLRAVRTLLAPGGRLALKDWARTFSPIHWLCYGADRWLTGDRIAYLTPAEACALLGRVFTPASIQELRRIGPWRNNYAFLLRR